MKKKTATELRLKAKIRQKAMRNRKKALGLKQLNVWIDRDAFNILSELQKNLKHRAKAETVEWAIYLLRRRVESHIRDTSGAPPGFNLLD
jgi:hypothetical protein